MDLFAKATDIVVVVVVVIVIVISIITVIITGIIIVIMAVVDRITIVGIINFIMLRLVYNSKLRPDLIILYFHLFTNIILLFESN